MKKRRIIEFPFTIDPLGFIQANPNCVAFLNSNSSSATNLLAWGIKKEIIITEARGAFEKLKSFQAESMDWMMGYLSYDLKNDIEDLDSKNPDALHFPLLHFFIPLLLIELKENVCKVHMDLDFDEETLRKMMEKARDGIHFEDKKGMDLIFHGLDEQDYSDQFTSLRKHIQRGDIYEVNYCLEFKASEISIDPLATYHRLNKQTEAPFSVFYHNNDHYLLCGSPERYLKKEGTRIISQPIKGTSKRGLTPEADIQLKEILASDPKEQAENVMIVDLVRNDLSKIANKASVRVDELFGVYTFKSVHQLISTISCEVDPDLNPVDIIKASFPMGSMTGAPKMSAMNIIEEHENFRRGIYSGAFGYFTPEGDFDFNVVIRSILYNEAENVLSFPVGGAITSLANARDEYHECILKAKAMKKALQGD